MKRLHVHVAVDDLEASIRFYNALFANEPSVHKSDYAKWALDDPRVNFAISQRGLAAGVDHLGIQVESDEELLEIHGRLAQAELPAMEQTGATCCYARSDKYWSVDPNGIPWESFHSLEDVPVYGPDSRVEGSACCAPTAANIAEVGQPQEATGSGCGTNESRCC
jgi:catechol 2,3-dioxygenase-like lactoylglutathione lyase family enzyme